MTTPRGGQDTSETEKLSRIRRIGWVVFPVLGVLAAVGAHALHVALAWRGSPEIWHALETWVPTIVPAYADYTVDPWPTQIWVALLVTLAVALAAFSTFVLGTVRHRPWWLRTLLLWTSFVIVAVGVVGIAQIGEWLLQIETFGGLGGSHLRTFTAPALIDAIRWGLIWGWIPAILTTLTGVPRPERPRRRPAIVVGIALVVVAVIAGSILAMATYGAALSARTEVAQSNEQASPGETNPPEPTDPPSPVATTSDPDFPGRCAESDVVVSIASFDAATGSRYLAFEARNVSAEPCDLHGTPDLAFASEDGNEIRPLITPREITLTGGAMTGESVTLDPGGEVRADLVWRAPTGRPAELTILMAPWAGAERSAATDTLDIVDGGEMGLTPWYALE